MNKVILLIDILFLALEIQIYYERHQNNDMIEQRLKWIDKIAYLLMTSVFWKILLRKIIGKQK